MSHIFQVTGPDVKLVSDFTAKVQFGDLLLSRRLKFLNGLTISDNAVFEFLTLILIVH